MSTRDRDWTSTLTVLEKGTPAERDRAGQDLINAGRDAQAAIPALAELILRVDNIRAMELITILSDLKTAEAPDALCTIALSSPLDEVRIYAIKRGVEHPLKPSSMIKRFWALVYEASPAVGGAAIEALLAFPEEAWDVMPIVHNFAVSDNHPLQTIALRIDEQFPSAIWNWLLHGLNAEKSETREQAIRFYFRLTREQRDWFRAYLDAPGSGFDTASLKDQHPHMYDFTRSLDAAIENAVRELATRSTAK